MRASPILAPLQHMRIGTLYGTVLSSGGRSLASARGRVTSFVSVAGTGRRQASVYPRAFSSRLSTFLLQCACITLLLSLLESLPAGMLCDVAV